MEANQNITMEPYNIEYYIAKYGTVENLTKDYIEAIDGLRLQYRQYETNPRKGGRYRREKMEHIRQQAEAIYQELLRVSRAMKEYFAARASEKPQISTEAAETVNVSAEGEKAPKYSISERDGNVYVTFKRGVIRQCAKRCGVSCKSAEWNTIAQAYNGTHSDMGMGLSFFFDGREDAVRFAELVCNGDISGYYKLYMDKIIAEGEARKKRIAEKCAEYDAAQAYFAECMADEDAETVNVSVEAENAAETKENCHNDTRIVSDGYGTQYEVTRHWKNGRVESLDVIVLDTQPQTATEPPQSPETPQAVECTADTLKPRETARKPQNRGIGNTRHSRLGANGYAILDNASATLTAMHVPLEYSTADAVYW